VTPQRLVQDSLLASAAAAPGKVAIVDEQSRCTYAELCDDSLRFARALQDAGLERGDRVALYLDNTAQCAASIFGVLMAGGAFTFINPQTKAGKLAFILNDSEARFLVAEAHSASGRSPPRRTARASSPSCARRSRPRRPSLRTRERSRSILRPSSTPPGRRASPKA